MSQTRERQKEKREKKKRSIGESKRSNVGPYVILIKKISLKMKL